MSAFAKPDPKVWRLAGASKYERNHGGTFAPSTAVSSHMFGWDREKQAFLVQDHYGMAGPSTTRLPVPVGLAELFLMRCLEPEFAQRFLRSYSPSNEEKETLELGGDQLVLTCSAYHSGSRGRGATLPMLSLSSGQRTDNLRLFYGLRESLGNHLKKLSPDEIRTHLRPR